jgi:hypothetical protein
MRTLFLSSLAFLALTASAAPVPPTETTKLDTSLIFARGSYGLATDTDVYIAQVSPTYENNTWRLQATLPFIHLSGPATVVGNTGTTTGSHSASGVGDLSLSAAYKLETDEHGWESSVGLKLKLPTADDTEGLGTGKADESFQLDVIRPGGSIIPFANVGYQLLGKSAAYPMKSGFYASGGFATTLAPGYTGGLAANWRERTIRSGKEAFELMAFAQHELNQGSKLQGFVMLGTTDASPDFTLGLTYGLNF